jgi:hypothetical protein
VADVSKWYPTSVNLDETGKVMMMKVVPFAMARKVLTIYFWTAQLPSLFGVF